MVDEEVEIVLREIRERVLSAPPPEQTRSAVSRPVSGNRAGDSLIIDDEGSETASEVLARIGSYLTTTGRAWDRLPPLVSNRSGLTARLELWLKRRLRIGTRWFTWEQVNFNAAVHHALRDILQVLSAYQQELGTLRAETDAANEARRIQFETELAALRAEIPAQRHATEALHRVLDAQKAQATARLTELVKELRERDEHLRDEQRVCLKQLSLETTEAAVLEDRARRKGEVFLEELKRRIDQLEASLVNRES